MDEIKPSECPECKAVPGCHHERGCSVERCGRCGHQSISCSCLNLFAGGGILYCEWGDAYFEPTPKGIEEWENHPENIRLAWSGYWPGVMEARALGWFAFFGPEQNPPQPGWISCSPDAPGAVEDLNRFFASHKWDRETQTYVLISDGATEKL